MKKKVKLHFKKLDPSVNMPSYGSKDAAGLDIEANESVSVYVNASRIIGTGLAVEIPDGYELQVRPRSGLSAKTGLMICNSPGTIDSDYRGEIKIIMRNVDRDRSYRINKGERIAQLVLAPVVRASVEEVQELSSTERGENGLGSTGK
jgi:dUTP pyrophosphatase